MDKCLICGEYKIWTTHTCQPCYYVWPDWMEFIDIYDSKHYKIFARDEEQAVIRYAERDWEFPNNENLYVALVKDINEILDNNPDEEFTDEVIKLIMEKTKKFEIESELIRNFSASEVK